MINLSDFINTFTAAFFTTKESHTTITTQTRRNGHKVITCCKGCSEKRLSPQQAEKLLNDQNYKNPLIVILSGQALDLREVTQTNPYEDMAYHMGLFN